MTPTLSPGLVLSPVAAPAGPLPAAAPVSDEAPDRLALISLQCLNLVAQAILDELADAEEESELVSYAEAVELASRYCDGQLAARCEAVYDTPFDTRPDELEKALRPAGSAPVPVAGEDGVVRLRRLFLTALAACVDALGRVCDAHAACAHKCYGGCCLIRQDSWGMLRLFERYFEVVENSSPFAVAKQVCEVFGVEFSGVDSHMENSGVSAERLREIILQVAREIQ